MEGGAAHMRLSITGPGMHEPGTEPGSWFVIWRDARSFGGCQQRVRDTEGHDRPALIEVCNLLRDLAAP